MTAGGLRWVSPAKLARHFNKHGHEFGFTTVGEYENSALDTNAKGTRFTYVDNQTQLPRVGYFEPATGRFTGLTVTEASITPTSSRLSTMCAPSCPGSRTARED